LTKPTPVATESGSNYFGKNSELASLAWKDQFREVLVPYQKRPAETILLRTIAWRALQIQH